MDDERSWDQKPKASKSAEKKNKQQQQDHPPPKQQRQSSRGGLGQHTTSGNTWASGDAAKREGKAATMPQDEHIPVNGFNAQEAREALKQGYNVPADEKPLLYKSAGKEVYDSKSGPWGSKSNTMANGKDFFVELRKQMHPLLQQQQAQQQTNNISGG